MKSLVLALQFMTRLPLPEIAADEADFARAIRWFPAAGLVVGAAVAGAAWLGSDRGLWAGALLALLAWTVLTGALHLDGLGDIIDAVGAAHDDPDRLHSVLSDPHVGSFGVTAICLQIAAKLVLLRLALESGAFFAIALIPVLARSGPIIWTLMLPPLHSGVGTLFRGGANWWVAAAWLVPLATLAGLWSPPLLVAFPAIALWAWWLQLRLGGISGDGHGAGIELVETAALAGLVFAG